MRWLWLSVLGCGLLCGHVGVNDVFFEGLAGVYPLYVTIRPPVVIPGVAEIQIRSGAKDLRRIRISPMPLTGAGAKYPPTPDVAVASASDPQSFSGALWIMAPGSWQVQVEVEGDRGKGAVAVPVAATSQKVSRMDGVTGTILFGLMVVLAAGAAGIAGAAAREAQLAPGQPVDAGRKRKGRLAMGGGIVFALGVIWFGGNWWEQESQAYARSIYKPLEMGAEAREGRLHLRLKNTGSLGAKFLDDFLEDHGHLMHLYLIGDPDSEVVYHLHPNRLRAGEFDVKLPELATGSYRLFADVVHGNGFPETIRAVLQLQQPTRGGLESPDDAGGRLQRGGNLEGGGKVIFEPVEGLGVGKPVSLRFRVLDGDGNPAANLKPYLGMAAHLAVVRKDFQVFAHTHPAGTISMAAFEIAQSNPLLFRENVLVSGHGMGDSSQVVAPEFSFPFGFPVAGAYRLILQFQSRQRVETVLFDLDIPPLN